MTRPSGVIDLIPIITLEEALRTCPWLKRPEGWRPRYGENVWSAQGGDHPMKIVRVGDCLGGDLYQVAIPAGTLGARIRGTATLDYLWPLPGWEEERERFDREVRGELVTEI